MAAYVWLRSARINGDSCWRLVGVFATEAAANNARAAGGDEAEYQVERREVQQPLPAPWHLLDEFRSDLSKACSAGVAAVAGLPQAMADRAERAELVAAVAAVGDLYARLRALPIVSEAFWAARGPAGS